MNGTAGAAPHGYFCENEFFTYLYRYNSPIYTGKQTSWLALPTIIAPRIAITTEQPSIVATQYLFVK